MASFPDLRPHSRSATAESTAVRTFRAPLLLAVSTALLLTAFIAVSELATLRGAKAPDTSAYLARELGPPLDHATLVRRPAQIRPALGGKLEIANGGLTVSSGTSALSLSYPGRAMWRSHANGVSRRTPFGREAITFGDNRVEQSLLVDDHQGTRIWRWQLGTKLEPRVAADGSIRLGKSPLSILPVAIFDADGTDITPHGLRWSLAGSVLRLRLDDSELPTPYVIDPVAIVGACGPGTGDFAGCTVRAVNQKTDFTSSPFLRPSSVATGDLMLAQITMRNNDNITAPAGWTQIGNKRTSGTGLQQALYYRVATAADTPTTTYSWSWTTTSDSSGAILAYSGVDASNPFDVTPTDNANTGTTATATGLTATQNGDMLVALYASTNNATLTQNAGEGLTQEYTALSGGGQRARVTSADGTQASPGASGNKTAALSTSQSWVAHFAALTPALAADGSGTLTTPTTNVSAGQTGRTITFTYTAAAGGMINGTVTLAVPSGWTAPSTAALNAGYTTASTGTLSVASQTITVSNVTLAGGATMTITYGSTAGGGPGATATPTTGAQTWQAQQRSKTSGTLANLGSSPSITVNAADGTGTLTSGTNVVSASQTGRTVTFTYTAATGGMSNGSVTVAAPSGWSAPSITATNAGYTTASTGTVSVASQTITVSNVTIAGGATMTITYGSTAGGGPGATATSSTGAQTWQAQQKSTSAGSLANLGSSPSITVYAADGSGTLTSGTSAVSAGQTGRTITFTYTAAAGGISNGAVTVDVPSGWSAPSTTGSNAGYTTASTGTLSVSSQTITVSSLTLAGGATLTIAYGSTASGGPGATATSTAGAQTWQAQEKSTSAGTLTNLGSSPSITVYAADGSGTLTSGTSAVSASQTGRTITFTYTAATGGISNGSVTLVVPAGWSAPSTTGSNAGYTTANSGTVSVAGQTITVSSLTVAGGSTFTITYGSTASGGPGATATSGTGAQTWQAQAKSTSAGSLTNLGSSPSISVYAADGSGTLTTGTSTVSASQTGRTITFMYTAAAGGISNGSVTLDVPTGWSTPSTTGSTSGYTTASTGTVSVASQTITVSSITLAGGATATITYGSTAGGGPGATATSSTGAQSWQAQEKSTSGGSLTNIGSSPSITVYAPDGSGTLTTPTSNVSAGQTGRTITFTYTAATGGISNGTVTLDVPSGWSAPSTTGSNAGYTTSTAGTVSVASQTITVSSLTLAGGATATITYGSTAGGGPGATATSSTGAQTWQAQEKSTPGGSLTNLGSSPSVTVNAADGSGTLTTPTTTVVRGATGNTITFTYTAATGGISNGSVTLVVPAGWSAPSSTGSNPGYTTANSGTVSVASQTITVSSLTVTGGSTFTLTYGSTASGGPGATAPSSSGAQTWQAQAKSTSGGTLMNLASSPSITVLAADGSGTLTTPTGSVNSASTGNTITFTYTAAAGGMSNGTLTIAVPSGWSTPSTTGSNAGYTTSSTGTVSVASQTITVSSVTLGGGATMTVVYGSTAGSGSGATAPTTAAGQTWQAQQKSSSGGSLTNLAASPSITVNDTTAPPAPSLSFGSLSNASVTGSTVYIRQGTAGGFTVTGTSSDPESGIDHLAFPGGFGAGWTGGGADSSSPYTSAYTFSAAATAPGGTQNVTATNGWAMDSSATGFTVVADTTTPSVTAPGVTAGYYTTLSVPVTKNGGTDGGSGIDATTSVLERDEVALSNGACGTFTGSWSTVTLSGGNDTSVLSGKCYRYRELLSDKVGNQGTSAVSNVAKIDNSAPSIPVLSFSGLSANAYWDGSTFFFRPAAGGTFTVTASSTDGQSDIGSYTFGTLNSNGGSNFGGSQTGDHFNYTFGAATTSPSTARTVGAANGAGTSSADATYSIASDTTAPSVTAPTVTAGYVTSLSVPVTKNGGSDSGAGIDSATSVLQRDDIGLANGSCGTFTASWSTVTLSGGSDTSVTNGNCYRYRELLSDRVGNQGTSAVSNVVKVDAQAPGNGISLSSVSPAGSALKAGSRVYYRGAAAGSFKLTNAVTDAESSPASSATAALGGTTAGWAHTPSTVSTPAGGPYESNSFAWSAGTTSSPTEIVTGADGAANTTAAATLTFTNDSTAPTGGALTVNGGAGYSTTGSFAIDARTDYSETQSATESGLASSTLTRAAGTLTNNSCGGYGSPTTLVGAPAQTLATGCYLFTLTGTDNVGNTTSVSATVKVDTSNPSAPTFSFSNFVGTASSVGETVFFLPTGSGSFDITASSTDGDSDIGSYTFPTAASFGSGWSRSGGGATRTYSWTPGSATPGPQTVTAANNAGRTANADFSVVVSDASAPTTTIQCNGAACQAGYYISTPVSVTLSADDGPTGSGVDVILYTLDGSDPTALNGSDYVAPIDVFGTTTVKFRAYDNLGNEEAVGSKQILIDSTPPNLSLALAENPASGGQHVNGTTLYYRPGAGGTFSVTATTDDPQTGIDSVDFPSVTNVTGGGQQTSAPFREDYTWASSTTDSGSHDVRATNGAGATTTASFTLTPDSGAPTGQTITLTGAGAPYYGATSVSFSTGDGSDGGSDLDTSTRTVTRETGTLNGDSCSGFIADGGTFSSPDSSVTGGHCYRYTFTIADRVGNVSAPVTATAKVDTAAPSITVDAPTPLSGAGSQYYASGSKTLFFRSTATGSFRLNSTSSDTHTAVQTVTYPDLSAVSGWSTTGTDSNWSNGATSPNARNITATDKAGNTANDTITITDDTTGPSGHTITLTGPDAPYYTGGSVTFSLGNGSDGGAGLDLSSATVTRETGTLSGNSCSGFVADGGTFASPDSAVTTGHCYWYTFTIADNVGNVSAAATATAKVDTDDPSVSLTDPGTPIAGSITLNASAADPSTDAQQVVFERTTAGGSTWTTIGTDTTPPFSAGWNTTGVSDGLYDLRAVATDTTNHTSTSVVTNRRVDNTGPNTAIDTTPPDPSNDAMPNFAFSSTEAGSSFECRVDGGSWSPCSSPETPAALGAGSHTFDVRATDTAGNTDATPASFTWTIDLSAPDTTIDSTPADPTNDTTPTFAFSSTETGSFACSIDGASWSPCSSPDTLSALGAGSHTFDVRATDAAGNTDATPASFTWAIDLTAPNTTIDSAPADPTNDTTPTFAFSSTESSSFQCRIDAGGWSSCASPETLSALPGGSHTFDVRATDTAGNTDATPASFTWTIDLTAPNTTVDLTPADPTNDTTPTFAFSSTETGSFDCRIDGGSWSPCSSPDTLSALGAGNHTFDVRATDSAGNTDATAASYIWTIDLTAPNTTIDSTPNDPTNDTTPTFAFSSTETGSFDCRIDGGSWSPCSSPDTLSALGAGNHTFDVRVTDTAGNTDATPASFTWKIDLAAPDTTIDAKPSDPSGDATPTFDFSSSEFGSSFECRIDAGSWSPCSSPDTLSALGAGNHTFDVRATDTAGNTDATPASYTWSIDLTAPDTTIDSGPGDPSNDTTPMLAFSSTETGSTFECRVDGGSYAPCTSPETTSALGAGSHTFRVRATDALGNTDASPAAFTWTIDLTAPDTTIGTTPPDPSNDTTPTFAFSSSETGSTFECRVDGAGWAPCSSPETLAALTAGGHTFDVRATDAAGNTDGTPASFSWTIDLTAPNTTIDSGPTPVDNDSTPTLAFSANESGSTFECRIDSGSWVSCSSPHTVSPALLEGGHTFDVRAIDAAGNSDSTPAGHSWTLDLFAPTVSITDPTAYVNGSDPTTYVVLASSPNGDVMHVDFFECSNASAACATGTWSQFGTDNTAPYSASWSTPAFDGARAIRAVAVDAGANTGEDVKTITIDRTAPSNVTVAYPGSYVFGSYSITTNDGPDPDVNPASGVLEGQVGDLGSDNCSAYGSWGSASSPATLASGKCARYRYRLADNAGNWTTATSTNEVKSDTAAPTSTLADPGANLRQTITLSAAANDTGGSGLASVAFQRRPAGGGSWTTIATDTGAPYSTSFDTTSVADGLYDFRSVAADVAGTSESSPTVVANRRIDNTPPSATMLSPGNPIGNSVTLTSNTSDTGGSGIATVAYELAPNGGSFNSQSANWDTTLAADGLYDLHVIATDVAGNSTTSALVTTRVDNTPPALSFTTPANGAVVSGTVNLVASASDASPASPSVSFEYKLHSDPASAYSATDAAWNTSSLPAGDGLYDLRATATDDAGNDTLVENTNVRVDNTAPNVSITAPAAAINGSLPSPTPFSANADDGTGSGIAQVQFFECSNQSTNCATGIWSPLGTVAAPGPYSVSWPIPGSDGTHALAAVATDNAGHPTSAIRNVDVDRTSPNTSIATKPADPSNAATPAFTFGSNEPGASFECRIDGGAFTPCTSPRNVTGLTDNAHTFEVRATDPAGNTDPSPDSWTWHRDTNNPTGSVNSPGANIRQSVTVTSTENDPPADGFASGVDSVTYEYSSDGATWAPIGTLSSAPFDSISWNTTAVTDGVYQLHVVIRDVAGNATTSAAVTNVRIDNTAPTTSQNDPGQYLRATKTLTGSAADGGSGVDHVDFQRAPNGGGSWTTIATDSTPGDGLQASFDTTGVLDGHYDFRTVAFDVAGNQASSAPVLDRLVDNTAPNATMTNPGAYLRGAVNLSSSTSDPGGANASGITGVAYEFSTNGGASWQPTGASFDSTSAPDGNVSLHVIATDAAGNSTTSAAQTSLADNTKPVTTNYAPSGWQSSGVTVTLTPNDGGSGINVTEYSVDGSPTYTVGTSVVIPAPADGSNDGAHTIAYFSVDNAGNIETVKSTTVLIDATPPACPSCSAADYLRGTVTLSAAPSESGSGIQSVSFEYTTAGGSTWTAIGTDTTGPAPYSTSWNTIPVADGHYDLRISVTDNANNVTTTNLPDKVVDNTAPDVATVGAPTEAQVVGGTVAIAATASDATSPVAAVHFYVRGSLLGTVTTPPFSLNWNTTSGSDGAATIEVVVEDMAGNTTTSPTRNVSVDNVAPTPTLANPGQNLSGTVTLTATSDPDTVQVDFERRAAGGGSWVTIASDTGGPFATPLDTTTLTDGLYDFRAVATDQTAHSGTSAIRSNIRIDNTSPSGSITSPADGATIGGSSVQLSASVSDSGSGVASVRYEHRPTGGGAFSTIATSTSAPFGATWDATTVSTGSYDLRPVITDRAGNTFTGATITVDVDVTAPTVVLANPGATISATVGLNATVSGSGATQVAFAFSPAGGAAWTWIATDTNTPWSASFDTSKLDDGAYDLRATVTDNLGNTSEDVVTGVQVDNTAPRVVSSTPAEGSTVSSASSISLVTSEAATVNGVTLDGAAAVAPVISGNTITFGTGVLSPGPHTLAGELQDSSGKKAPFRVHFTVWSSSGPVAPAVEGNTTPAISTTVQSADGFAAATMPPGAWSTGSNDWIVLRITPLAPPSGLTNGFGPGPEALDVTALWALAGTQLHEFSQPLSILMRTTEKGLAPATFDGGSWRFLRRVPTAGTLPSGWEDGFYADASGFHVLTKHLSVFALLHDFQPPEAPQNLRGFLGTDGLTLTWTPGADNSGTYDFVTLFVGSADSGHYGVDHDEARVGAWSSGDPRIFRLKETDLAGNESPLTLPLRPVPPLVGKTVDQVTALLTERGFSVGQLIPGGSGPAGMVTGPAGLVLAGEGSTIDLTVTPGTAGSKFAFRVVTAPKYKPAPRKKLAARITLTRAARVTTELLSPRGVKIYTWRFSARAGHSIVKLGIPKQVRRTGVYSLRWTARAGKETISRRIKVRLVKSAGALKPVQRVGVVLTGSAGRDVKGKLPRNAKLLAAAGIDPTFDAAASRTTDVRVIVLDTNQFGTALIRDLHAVFPTVKIVALASTPRGMVTALRAGAAIALPRSTPPSTLARVIQRLLHPQRKPVARKR